MSPFDANAEMGRVKVQLPDLEADIRPTVNVIDSKTLELVTTAVAGEEVQVPVGQYVLSSTLPSGERSLGVADVSPGELEHVELAPETAPSAVEAVPEAPQSPQLESLGPSTDGGESGAEAQTVEAPTLVEPFFLRYLGVSGDRVEPLDVATEVVAPAAGAAAAVDLVVRAPGYNGVVFVQLAAHGEVPLSVALPANGMTGSQSCRVTVATKPLAAVVSLPDSPLVDAVARYIHSGNLQEAANVAGEAEELLRQKMRDPFAAALGGYALLRLHELARLHDWPHNLAAAFPWLADGPIIDGEAAALAGDHGSAVDHLCEAARRGLPVFADGFSMLVSRLREYDQPDKPPGVTADLLAEVARQAKRLVPLTPLIDFSRISLAIHGGRLDDPLGSQEPIAEPGPAEGWHRFSPDTATLGS
jgi:hypothetical protein